MTETEKPRDDLHYYRAHKPAAKAVPTRAPGWSSSLYPDAVLYGPTVSQTDHQSGKGTWQPPPPPVPVPPLPRPQAHGGQTPVGAAIASATPEERVRHYVQLMQNMNSSLNACHNGTLSAMTAVGICSAAMAAIQRLGEVDARKAKEQLAAVGIPLERRVAMVQEYRHLLNIFPRTYVCDYDELMNMMSEALQHWMGGRISLQAAVTQCSRVMVEVQQMGSVDTAETATNCAQRGLDEPTRRQMMYDYLELLRVAAGG